MFLVFLGYYQLLNENNFLLGIEVFKKYYHLDLVNKTDEMAKKLGHKSAGISLAKKIYH